MTQVNSSPGVPRTLPTVTASSASPILVGPPPNAADGGIIGTGVVTTLGVNYWVSSTGVSNVWSSAQTEGAKVVSPFQSSTPIVLPNQVGNSSI